MLHECNNNKSMNDFQCVICLYIQYTNKYVHIIKTDTKKNT